MSWVGQIIGACERAVNLKAKAQRAILSASRRKYDDVHLRIVLVLEQKRRTAEDDDEDEYAAQSRAYVIEFMAQNTLV